MLALSFVFLFLTVIALICLHSYMFKLFDLVTKDFEKYGGAKMLTALFVLETLLITVTFGFLVYGFIIFEEVRHQLPKEPTPIIKTIKLAPQQRVI